MIFCILFLIVNIYYTFLILKTVEIHYGPLLLLVYYFLQLSLIHITYFVFPNEFVFNLEYVIPIREILLEYNAIYLFVLLSFFLSSTLIKHNKKRNILKEAYLYKFELNKVFANNLLLVLAIIYISSSLQLIPASQAFLLSVQFTPFILGLFVHKLDRKVIITWYLAILISLIFHSVQGSRGTAFIPIFTFTLSQIYIGYINKSIKKTLLIIIFIGVPFFFLFGKIGDFRIEFTRGMEVNATTAVHFMNYIFSSDYDQGKTTSSLSRLINNTDLSVIHLAQNENLYRPITSLYDELEFHILSFGASQIGNGYQSLRTQYLGSDFGIYAASKYGYLVSETNSVEFGILADSFSLGGNIGVLIYFFIVFSTLKILELFLVNKISTHKHSLLFILFASYLIIGGIYNLYQSSYLTFIRSSISRILVITVIYFIVYRYTKLFRK